MGFEKKEDRILFPILEDRVYAMTLANQQTPNQIKKFQKRIASPQNFKKMFIKRMTSESGS